VTKLLALIPKSIPEVRRALAAMGRDLDAARTYEQIRRIEQTAEAFKKLFAEVEDVRRQAEEVIILARHRIGQELANTPTYRGRPTSKKRNGHVTLSTRAEQVGSRMRASRLIQLGALDKSQLKEAVRDIQASGKANT
jgi:hypothetical protein